MQASPHTVELPVGQRAVFEVTLLNTSDVIDAYRVGVFGLDRSWVTVTPDRVSLFPGDTFTVTVIVQLPADFPAGPRTVSIHVRSENDPRNFTLSSVTLDLVEVRQPSVRVDPTSVTGRASAVFSVVVGNEGNAPVELQPEGIDPEARATFTFDPPVLRLPAGHRDVVKVTVRGGRHWFGVPRPRVLTFGLVGHEHVRALGTFVQKPRIPRAMLSLVGLLLAASVFAAVLARTFQNVVDEAKVDTPTLQQALDQPKAAGNLASLRSGGVTGKVVLFTSGAAVAGVQADLFGAGDGAVPVGTAATGADGSFTFGRLPAGKYRLRFSGAGFATQWYGPAITFADAADVEVVLGQPTAVPDVALSGQPGVVKGVVKADDPSGAVATLLVPGVADPTTPASVLTADVSADGAFAFTGVPSPASYQLVVQKSGYATAQREVVVGPAATVDDVQVALRRGDGLVSGQVLSPDGPLGGVTVTASDGNTQLSTVSLTEDSIGFFAVRGLSADTQYTITFSRPGYTSETRTVALDASAQVTGLAVTLNRTLGAISGRVSVAGVGPAGGITVTVTGGAVTVKTVTASIGDVGGYSFTDLPMPATYTITFSRTGLVGQSRIEDLDPVKGRAELVGIDATLVPAAAVVRGVVSTAGGPVAGATVVLSDGVNQITVPSADEPPGGFEIANVAPGTYTLSASFPGTSSAIVIVTVVAAETRTVDLTLAAQASISGTVEILPAGSTVFAPYVNATVRLFAVGTFPGAPGSALATTTTDANGAYTFAALTAPENFVVAVYPSATAADPLASTPAQTQPSTRTVLPTIRVVP